MKLISLIMLLSLFSCLKPQEVKDKAHVIQSMASTLDKQYPGVLSQSFSTVTQDTQLVDLRTPAETDVSTLPNAISKEEFEADPTIYQNKQIVGFDTLGQRSIVWVSEQRAYGIEAFNLQGGVLAWAHAGGKFVTPSGEETKTVHVYAQAWDMLPEGFEAITE